MQLIILISILLIALIYLHIVRSHLVFQSGVKTARTLLIIALILAAGSKVFVTIMTLILASSTPRQISRSLDGGFVWFTILYDVLIWILVIIAYGRFFAGCQKFAFFKKVKSVDPLLRAKVSEILLEVIERKFKTDEYRMFLHVSHEDPLVESVRAECEKTEFSYYTFTDEVKEKLTQLAEKLNE